MSLAVMQADNFDGNFDYNAEFVTMYATAAVTTGDWVAFLSNNTSNPGAIEGMSIITADSDNAYSIANTFGVAAETTTAAGMVRVQIRGKATNVNVATGSTQGLALVISSTAGRATLASGVNSDDYRTIGVALSDASSNLATVLIHPHPAFIQ